MPNAVLRKYCPHLERARPALKHMSHPNSQYSLSDFDFDLPPALIAQHPVAQRSDSRLLDGRADSAVKDRVFKELPELLQAGDLLVFNDTQVVKARLFGEKPSGGKLELLVERVLPDVAGEAPHQVVEIGRAHV